MTEVLDKMAELPLWLAIILLFVLRVGGIGILFAIAARGILQRAGIGALVLWWILASLVWGYLAFRKFCGMPLTCDVLMIGMDSIHDYWRDITPGFAVIAAVTLAAAFGAATWLEARARKAVPPRPAVAAGRFVIVGAVTLVAWLAASWAVLNNWGSPRF